MKLFVEELENFPLCASKDWVDAFVHALAYASRPAEFVPRQVSPTVQTYDALEDDDYGSSKILRPINSMRRVAGMSGNFLMRFNWYRIAQRFEARLRAIQTYSGRT